MLNAVVAELSIDSRYICVYIYNFLVKSRTANACGQRFGVLQVRSGCMQMAADVYLCILLFSPTG